MTDKQMTPEQAEVLVAAIKREIANQEIGKKLSGAGATSSMRQRIFDDDEYMEAAKAKHQSLKGKDINRLLKKGVGLPFLHDYKANGKTEPVVPAGATKLQKAFIKNSADIEGRKWAVQARLRQRLHQKGEDSKQHQEVVKEERNFFINKGADLITNLKINPSSLIK
jgi:hypothetical protein